MEYKCPRSSSTPQLGSLHTKRYTLAYNVSHDNVEQAADVNRLTVADAARGTQSQLFQAQRSPPPSVKRHLMLKAIEYNPNEVTVVESQPSESEATTFVSRVYSNALLPTMEVLHDVSMYWTRKCLWALVPGAVKRKLMRRDMDEAESYVEWFQAALQLDIYEGKQLWKQEFACDMYDNALIDRRLDDIRRARASGDIHNLMFMLRAGLFRNLGNMGNPKLYTYCNVGTKRLIERYVEEVVRQLEFIAMGNHQSVTLADKIEFFRDIRLSFGRTALMLSGGGGLGAYHLGVVRVLMQHNLLPRIITGSSVGSIISAVVCCKNDQELEEMLSQGALKLDVFVEKDSSFPMLRKFRRLFEEGVLADIGQLREAVRYYVKDVTFQEAYNRTRRILNITVNSTNPHEGPRLLNYLTAPHVVVWSAVCASCSLTMLFKPVQLMAKTRDGKIVPWGLSGEEWSDGSVETDLPITRLSELFNVNHFIVSQVNPHILPFMHPHSPIAKFAETFPRLSEFFIAEVRHRTKMLKNIIPPLRMWDSILNQKYSGHVTIVPPVEIGDFFSLIDNHSTQHLRRCARIGERATWPKVNMIKIHCDIELTLDRIFYRLQERVFDQRDHTLAQTDYVADNHILTNRVRAHRLPSVQ